MRIESIKIKNYRVFQDIKVEEIPNMAVFLGMNGAGKTTLFDVFGFLHDALQTNIKTALAKRGDFNEVISRGQDGDIEFEIKFRPSEETLIIYQLAICLTAQQLPAIKREVLKFHKGKGAPWKVLEFAFGKGRAANGKLNTYEDIRLSDRRLQQLDSPPDILAIKGLGQFKDFPAVTELRRLIEDWYVSDFHIEDARITQDAVYSERISTSGDNLALVAKYLYDNHRSVFDGILFKMEQHVPGVKKVEAQETEDGRIVLRFQEGNFKDPFVSRFVSDGTIKIFTYLLLLHDPEKHALLCVEEPENQLYPHLLRELAEEFRSYSELGGQVFISTHSPDFLNAVELEELYCLVKENGYTKIYRAAENPRIEALYREGDLLGQLWRQDLLLDEVSEK